MKKGEWILMLFNGVYILGFAVFYLLKKNFEFLWYIAIMIFLFALVAGTLRKTQFSSTLLWALSIWGLLHMMGGGILVSPGKVLYAQELVKIWVTENFYVLKYDQFVHAYLYFVMVFVVWALIKKNLHQQWNPWVVYPIITLTSAGIGGLNEIAEFIAVLTFPETGVGGYYNTAWDIVFNTLGATLGTIVLSFHRLHGKNSSSFK